MDTGTRHPPAHPQLFAATHAANLQPPSQWYGYPDEWFPSVSATIGDWFPERNVFQILIALTSGPRFLLILVAFAAHRQLRPHSFLPGVLATIAAVRTVSCGGWVYITSSDHGDVHDVFMVLYIVLNLPYMILHTVLTPAGTPKSLRRILGTAFFATLVPLVYFYLEHKQKRVPGAYSIYALFEWALIVLDVAFDAVHIVDHSSSAAARPLELAVQAASAASIAQGVYLPTAEPAQPPKPPGRLARTLAKLEMATASTRHFFADTYLAFCFWTLLVALGPMIFYSAVWAMGLSGDEVLLFCILSPILLALPPLRRAFAHPALAHVGLLAGLAMRWVDDDGKWRLRGTAAGLALATCGIVARWWEVRHDAAKLDARARTFLLGLVVSLVVKFANFSLNPLWPFMRASTDPKLDNGGWNGVGLALAVLAYLDACSRRRTVAALPPAAKGAFTPTFLGKTGAIVGFGALFFLLHWLFTDSGTIIAWSWAGYPSSGPFAFPHGLLTIATLTLALFLPAPQTPAVALAAHAGACAAAAALYTQTSWASFLPGCLLGLYTLSLFPSFLSSVLSHSPHGPGAPFTLALGVYAALELASTWTVAYAFVPAGWLLRERTGTVLALALAGIGAGLLPAARVRAPSAAAAGSSAPGAAGRKHLLRGAALLFLFALLALVHRAPGYAAPGVPYRAGERVVTSAIWTVHFGLDGRMWESGRRMANMMRGAEIDVIGLLETDVHRMVGGNRDITQFISHSLNMPYVDLGPGPQKNTWGAALISKFPILRSSHHLLPSPAGELAPAIFATLDMYGVEVDVLVAHNGQEEDPLDRQLQSIELARLLGESWPRPAMFLGYLVTRPHAERPAPYKYLVEDGRMLDINPNDHDRWCQYIFYRSLHRVGYARLNRGANPSVTDSEVQVGKFVVPLASASASSYTSLSRALLAANASASVPPIPLEAYTAHLHSSLAPRAPEGDPTVWTPERYLPPALRFPKHLEAQEEEHRFIVLTGETGAPGAQYFMRQEEKEWRRLDEVEKLMRQADEGCPVQ
ncbi:Protein cwh43 [Rhodotorula kratochvilovae]